MSDVLTFPRQPGSPHPPGVNPFAPASVIADQVKRPIVHDSVVNRHAALVAAIIAAKPHVIRYVADAQDMYDRADHIAAIGKAFAEYIEEIVDDTSFNAPGGSNIDRDVHLQILDSVDQAVGQTRRIGEDLAEGSDW